MKFKQMMNECGIEGSKSYKIIGDIMVVKFRKWNNIGIEFIRNSFPYVKTIYNIKKIGGELRIPEGEVLWSEKENPTETIHTEWGIKYKMDVSKVMFSKGNLLERGRMLKTCKPGESVLDMFAGIGYFTLPCAKAGANVVAIEKNPDSFSFLKQNIKLNRLEGRVTPINDDNRKFSETRNFDRIIMGYFPGTEKFLETARKFSSGKTIIHYHNTYALHEIPDRFLAEIRKWFPEAEILSWRRVKKFGPSRLHVVVDFKAGFN